MKGMLLRHEKSTRIFHWVNLFVFMALLLSGLSIYHQKLQFFAIIFGGLKNAAILHQYFGFAYFIVPLIYIVTGFDMFKKFIVRISSFDADDIQWLKVGGGYMAPLIVRDVPEQGKFNAGQKSLCWMVIGLSCVLSITGLIMIFYTSFPPVLARFSYLIHAASGILLGCGVIVHFYLATFHPKSSLEYKAMMGHGYIEEEFAQHHNAKWYREMTGR